MKKGTKVRVTARGAMARALGKEGRMGTVTDKRIDSWKSTAVWVEFAEVDRRGKVRTVILPAWPDEIEAIGKGRTNG